MKAGKLIRIGIPAALIAGLLFFIIRYGNVFLRAMMPLWTGILLSYILLPIIEALDNRKFPRTLSILVSFLLSFFTITMTLFWLVPIFIDNIRDLTGVIPEIFEDTFIQFKIFVEKNIPKNLQIAVLHELDKNFLLAQKKVTDILYAFVSSIPKTVTFIFDILVAWILSFYILRDRKRIVQNMKYIFPKPCREDVVCFLRDIHRVVLRFIQGQILIAIILAILETLGLYLIGMPYAPLLGFIGGVSNIIPYFGPYIGAVPAMVIALTTSPWKAVWTAAVFIIVQQVDNIFLSPRIMKGKLGLHPVTTIMAVIAGGRLFGFAGLLFGVPIAAMIKILAKRTYRLISG